MFSEPSFALGNINEPSDCLGESCAQTPLLRVSLILALIQKDAEGGEAQVCVMLSQGRLERILKRKKMKTGKSKSLKKYVRIFDILNKLTDYPWKNNEHL